MLNISIITVFPELYDSFIGTSLIKRARDRGLLNFNLVKLSSFCEPGKRIDEPTVGHGPGMILKPEIVEAAYNACIAQFGHGYTIFFSPKGTKLTQPVLNQLAQQFELAETPTAKTSPKTNHLILVCARYEGMDERVEAVFANQVISIGDYVLMGGDLPAQLLLEGMLRLMPGVVGNTESIKTESFQSPFFDHPEYGLPATWHNQEIPPILRSGDHKAIQGWRQTTAARQTILKRFDWFRSQQPSPEAKKLAQDQIPPHYVVLMHSNVLVENNIPGTTSVTSIDLHDIARSSMTYGIKTFFIVTPLVDQQAIVREFVNFWLSNTGKTYNPSRFAAISNLVLCSTLDEVKQQIQHANGGLLPLQIATSAKRHPNATPISYADQGLVWQQNRPVLIVLGTGQGLTESLVAASDFLLPPLGGLSDYNHLSVRSAAAIILHRWLGLD